jgi:hypothetical protein
MFSCFAASAFDKSNEFRRRHKPKLITQNRAIQCEFWVTNVRPVARSSVGVLACGFAGRPARCSYPAFEHCWVVPFLRACLIIQFQVSARLCRALSINYQQSANNQLLTLAHPPSSFCPLDVECFRIFSLALLVEGRGEGPNHLSRHYNPCSNSNHPPSLD